MLHSLRTLRALVALSALALGGCTSLLGDFSYDPDGSGGGPPVEQGDIVLMPAGGLVTSETGTKATFTIMLKRAPTASVAIALSSSNQAEGTVSPNVLSFTPDNFGAPQMAQVTGVDDDKPDGPQTFVISTSPATSEDKTFHGINPIDPQVTNTDDDTAGFTLMPPAGLVTNESGGEATFTIQLNHAPTANVSVALSSDTPTEGTVSPAGLVFTPVNWMAPQTVTVTGVNDDAKDGPKKFVIVTGNAVSADPNYSDLLVPDEEVTNNDNDTAGVVLTPMTGLVTSEKLEMTSLTIALSSPPTGSVKIGLTSDDPSEGTVLPESVTFTPLDWMAPQVVSITGVNDDRVDGSQPYHVVTNILSSDDPDYATFEPPNADVINIDDDTPGLRITPTEGLFTGEDLSSAMFTVVLNSKPSADVVLDIGSSRPEEGVPLPTSLHFTEMNWDAPQVVNVMGVDDKVQDRNQVYLVHVVPNAATTLDPNYAGLLPQDVSLTNRDDDSAGVIVSPQKGLNTSEAGGTAAFTVKLTSQPTADVTIALSSSNTAEGTVSPAALTFTADNFGSEQLVTIRGVDDKVQDKGQPYRIVTENAVSADANYSGMEVPNVEVVNVDNDTAGITVVPNNSVTLTTEEKGTAATFTVRLNSQPKADVSFSLTSTDTGEGVVSPASLKFTNVNWNAPQTVTIKGVEDAMHDGPQPYRITFSAISSADDDYAKLTPPLDVKVSNTDNDTPGVTLRNNTGLTTTEKGAGTATFQVVLDSEPSGNVVIGLSSSRTNEGTVSPSSLTFTNINWASPQTVTVTGVNDDVQDGPQSYFIVFAAATSTDKDYQGITPRAGNVTVSNVDDDSAGIRVTPSGGLITSEPSATTTFTVQLNSQPTADVTIPLKSSKTSEGTVSPASLTFTSVNWNGARTVTLTGVDDKIVDGDQSYFIVVGPATSNDGKYKDKSVPDVSVSNHDDDTARIIVGAVSGDTSEKGGTATFTLKLQTQPAFDVTVPLTSNDLTEGTVSPASVTFTSVNWASPQTITMTGVDDKMQDGDQPYEIDVGVATSKDPNYQGLNPAEVPLKNIDNDTAKISVTQDPNKTSTSESGGTAIFNVVLETQPSAGVTLSFSSSDTKEGTLSDSSVTFTTADWASAKTITVTGVEDDGAADGNPTFNVVFDAAVSEDENYSGKQPTPIKFTNIDNDSAGIDVKTTEDKLTTSEDGKTFEFTIALTSKPKANVQIPIVSDDETEGVVSPALLTFTTTDWQSKQLVTVTGVEDVVDDGSPTYNVKIGAPISTDTDYSELDPPDYALTNIDNDTAGFKVTYTPGENTSEAGATATIKIRLLSKPAADVTIPISSSDNTEGTLGGITEVVLTPSDWSDEHVVTVHGEDDKLLDGDQEYMIVTGASSSADPNYDDKAVEDVKLKNVDNDTAGYTFVLPPNPRTTEAGGEVKFTIVLNFQPSAAVSIPIASNNVKEGVVIPATVTSVNFTVNNWDVPQEVTVKGVDDDVADGDPEYDIVLSKPTTTDANYAAQDPKDVTLTNVDNDSIGLDIGYPMNAMTSEDPAAPSVSFTVALLSKPKGTVTLPLLSSNENEGIITSPSPASLVFDASNWSTAQTVEVQGVDDLLVDMDAMYSIVIGPPASTDAGYAGLQAKPVKLINLDDDVP